MNEKTDSIDHICINVSNIEQAIAWFQSSFSCKVVYQKTQEAMLQFENIKLQLTLPAKIPSHLAFFKTDADTLGLLRTQEDGSQSTYISDTSGNLIEVIKTCD